MTGTELGSSQAEDEYNFSKMDWALHVYLETGTGFQVIPSKFLLKK